MVARMCKRPMQGFVNRERHPTDLHHRMQPFVVEVRKGPKENRPALLPLLAELCPGNGPVEELGVTVTPGLLTVGLKEVRKARRQVPRDVPHERRNGVASGTAHMGQLLVGKLLDRPFTERLVSPVLTLDRTYDLAHTPPRSARMH